MRLAQIAILSSNSEPVSEFAFQSVQTGTLNQVAITFKVDEGYSCYIDFGDGEGEQQITANGHDQVMTSSYDTANTTYDITVSGHLTRMKKFSIATETTVSNLDIDDFAANGVGLTYLHLQSLGSGITGSLNNLPTTLCYLHLESLSSGLTGDPSNLPESLYRLAIKSISTSFTGGTINSLPSELYRLELESLGNVLTGSINNLPNTITYLRINGIASFTGSSLPPNLILAYLFSIGNNIAINLDSISSTALRSFTVRRNLATGGAYTGSISSFNGKPLDTFYIENLGTSITGDIEDLPATLASSFLVIVGCGTNITYSGGAVPAWASVQMNISCGLSTAALDNFLNSWATTAGAGTQTITLSGTNQARSSASDAAVTTLTGLGKTIVTN